MSSCRRSSLRSTSATSGPIDRAAELARDGLQEARAAVGALRAPQLRGVENLASLVETFPGKARLKVTGSAGRLDAEAGHAAYGAVQEAITNAARYATWRPIQVNMAWDAAELRVRVTQRIRSSHLARRQ